MADYDLIVKGGTVVTAGDTMEADVGIRGGIIEAIGRNLGKGKQTIEAKGRIVTPGGVDSHAHVEQLSGMGLMSSDDFEGGTTAAAAGGTTSIVCFAAQHVGMSLKTVVEDYSARAKKGAVVDYAFHLMLADPTEKVLAEELPPLVRAGHSSIKVFMTYDKVRLVDEQLLDVLMAARKHGALVTVHAENHAMISWLGKRLVDKGYKAPKFHGISHPRVGEIEAFHRIIAMSELLDQPIMIFHVSTAEGAAVIREARARGLKVFGETCPQYLFLNRDCMDKPGFEGAKWIFSPPARFDSDSVALWQALRLGDLQAVTSDHAPYAFNENGKLINSREPHFKQTPNGMPGLEWRLPLMFDAAVAGGHITLNEFVRMTATEPAKIFNLAPRKGSIAVGGDADIVVWDPKAKVTLKADRVVSKAAYNPWPGRTLQGAIEAVLRRGEVIWANGKCPAKPGSGQMLLRAGGAPATPTGRLSDEFDSKRNFGANLY